MMTLLRCWCGFNTINKKRIYKKRETGTGNCIPGRLSPFGIMQSYAGGKPCDQNIDMLFYKHLAYCSV